MFIRISVLVIEEVVVRVRVLAGREAREGGEDMAGGGEGGEARGGGGCRR
jgi:hypothetical protein